MVSWVDSQVGRLLDALDSLDLWASTTVVLTSDHGMHNGEKGSWTKWMLFDESVRILKVSHLYRCHHAHF
jgi:arylsulfatase A-like enzyme